MYELRYRFLKFFAIQCCAKIRHLRRRGLPAASSH
jgi:hypothetical protein